MLLYQLRSSVTSTHVITDGESSSHVRPAAVAASSELRLFRRRGAGMVETYRQRQEEQGGKARKGSREERPRHGVPP